MCQQRRVNLDASLSAVLPGGVCHVQTSKCMSMQHQVVVFKLTSELRERLLGRGGQLSCSVHSAVSASAEHDVDGGVNVQVCLGHGEGALDGEWAAQHSCCGKVVMRMHGLQSLQSGCLTIAIFQTKSVARIWSVFQLCAVTTGRETPQWRSRSKLPRRGG